MRLDHPDICCSFCGKQAAEVEYLITGPNVFICAECVDQCAEILADFRAEEDQDSTNNGAPEDT